MSNLGRIPGTLLPRNEFSGGRLSLDFCNTLSRGPGRGPRDRLGSPEMLAQWAARRGVALEGTPDVSAFRSLLELRGAITGIFDHVAEGEAPDPRHLERLNGEIARAGSSERLIALAKGGWRLGDGAATGVDRLRHAIAKDAAQLLTGDIRRIKRCPAHDCLWLFYDSSKNQSRRWCAMDECGSRAKMRRLRAHPAH